MGFKLCKFCENHARYTPLRGVYIPHFGQIWVKIQFWGSYTLVVAPMGVKFGTKEGPPCQISPPSVQRVSPAWQKTSNRPLSKLNTGRFALRAMVPVKTKARFSRLLWHPAWKRTGLFWFSRFINMSLIYLLRHLPTYLQPQEPHGVQDMMEWQWHQMEHIQIICISLKTDGTSLNFLQAECSSWLTNSVKAQKAITTKSSCLHSLISEENFNNNTHTKRTHTIIFFAIFWDKLQLTRLKKPYILVQQWLYKADDIFRNQIQCTEDKRSDSLEKCISDYILIQEPNANVCHAQVQYICIFRQQLRSSG